MMKQSLEKKNKYGRIREVVIGEGLIKCVNVLKTVLKLWRHKNRGQWPQ